MLLFRCKVDSLTDINKIPWTVGIGLGSELDAKEI